MESRPNRYFLSPHGCAVVKLGQDFIGRSFPG